MKGSSQYKQEYERINVGESNMWQGNSGLHKISDKRKKEIDQKRIANGLQPWWSHLGEVDKHE